MKRSGKLERENMILIQISEEINWCSNTGEFKHDGITNSNIAEQKTEKKINKTVELLYIY